EKAPESEKSDNGQPKAAGDQDAHAELRAIESGQKTKRKGHGRRAASDYSGAENHSPRPNRTQRLPSVEIPYFNTGPKISKEPSSPLPASRLFPNDHIEPAAVDNPYLLRTMEVFDTTATPPTVPLPTPIPVSFFVTMLFSIYI